MCPKDIKRYRLGYGIEGACFEYETLASHAVLLDSKELLDICEQGLDHKHEDLAKKIDGTKNSDDRLSLQYRQGRVEIALLNGKMRDYWRIAPGTLKLIKSDEGKVRYDGSQIYINDTPHEGNETDYVKKLIVFKEVKDKSGEKLESRKGRSKILTPKSQDSGNDSSTNSGTESSIDSTMKKRGRASKKEEVSSADSSIEQKENKLADILDSLSGRTEAACRINHGG